MHVSRHHYGHQLHRLHVFLFFFFLILQNSGIYASWSKRLFFLNVREWFSTTKRSSISNRRSFTGTPTLPFQCRYWTKILIIYWFTMCSWTRRRRSCLCLSRCSLRSRSTGVSSCDGAEAGDDACCVEPDVLLRNPANKLFGGFRDLAALRCCALTTNDCLSNRNWSDVWCKAKSMRRAAWGKMDMKRIIRTWCRVQK